MTDDIKKRLKQREDMFLRRLFGMLAKIAKADGKVDAWTRSARQEGCSCPSLRADEILSIGG